MSPTRGELWWANLSPTIGSEQGGRRPVLIVQNNQLGAFTKTVLAAPLTTVLRRARLPSSAFIPRAGTGLPSDSIALCHQLRVLDKARLVGRIGSVPSEVMAQVELALQFTLGMLSLPGSAA